jgi:hypothetical protein
MRIVSVVVRAWGRAAAMKSMGNFCRHQQAAAQEDM